MNKKLIKKYKAEFNLWIEKENALLCLLDNPDENWFTVGKMTKIWNSDYPNKIKHIIINDEYVEFRKALCENKTVQYYVDGFAGWQDVTTVGNHCIVGAKNYRIKPEKHQFEVGDFVRYKNIQNGKAMMINNINCGYYYMINSEEVFMAHELIKWEPENKELCWFTDIKDFREYGDDAAVLGYFDSKHKDTFMTISGLGFKYCEPFLNSKPSWFKD